MKYKVLLLIVLIFLVSCSERVHSPVEQQEWKCLGLGGRWIHKLRLKGNVLYAGTDDGVYRKDITSPDTIWTPIGLQGKHAVALLVVHPDTILASVVITEVGSDTLSLFRTTDGGTDWQAFQNGFGGGGSHQVMALAKFPGQSDTLFATGACVVAKSTDGGSSWRRVWGGWHYGGVATHFITVDSASPNTVWAGGESGFFAAYLVKSTDRGENWQTTYPDVGGDNACLGIAIDPSNSDVVYVSMEGKVIKTIDGGTIWNIVLEEVSAYLFAIAINPYYPSVVYVTGGVPTPQPLILYKTRDAGCSWFPISQDAGLTLDVRDFLLLSNGKVDKLYLGTIQDGVYQYTALTQK
ncbi:MAG TPA: hypothetical protein VGB16_03840 [candidate division Zixibacteria bacterium]